jgi:hypothetical protein
VSSARARQESHPARPDSVANPERPSIRTTASVRDGRARISVLPLSPAGLIDLQRTAGNAATTRLVLQRTPATDQAERRKAGPSSAPSGQDKSSSQDATDAYAAFDSVYSAYCGTYSSLAMKQQAAINSLYTEAKKPEKPGVFGDLLVALALAGLGSVGSLLATKLERATEKALLKGVADPRWHSNEALKDSIQLARDNVKMVAKAAGDGLKAGVNQFVGPKIRELLQKGKSSVDAFYEGQISSVIDAGQVAKQDSQLMSASVWELHHAHPALPMIIAQALLDSADETFAEAEKLQTRSTLEQWLVYEAQATQEGSSKAGTEKGTDLSNEGWEGGAKGILRILSHVEGGQGGQYSLESDRGNIYGLTEFMLKTLTGPIADLHLPTVYIVSSWERHDGGGVVDDGLGTRNRKQSFKVAVNEKGTISQSQRYPWQDKALGGIGGIEALLSQLGKLELEKLPGVEADRG